MRRFVPPTMKTEEFHSDEGGKGGKFEGFCLMKTILVSEEDGMMAMAEDDSFNFGGKDLTKLLDVGTDTETTNGTVYGLIGVPLDEGFEEELMSGIHRGMFSIYGTFGIYVLERLFGDYRFHHSFHRKLIYSERHEHFPVEGLWWSAAGRGASV